MINKPTIQANNLNVLFKIWQTFSNDEWFTNKVTAKTIGYSDRQGQYYNQSLHRIGILEVKKIKRQFWYQIKEEYRSLDLLHIQKIFKSIVTSQFIKKELRDIKKEKSNTTKKRRESAIKSWSLFIESNRISKTKAKNKFFEFGKAKIKSSELKDFKPPKKSTKKSITTETNKGFMHTEMMNVIGKYALEHNVQIIKENCNADLTSYDHKKQTFKIIEIKSYPALYLAVGQLLHYEHKFQKIIHTNETLKYIKIYVGVEKLEKLQMELLEKLNIKYVNFQSEEINNIFS